MAEIEASRSVVERRRAEVPEILSPSELPVSERRGEVAALIARHQVVILCGETGSEVHPVTKDLPEAGAGPGRGGSATPSRGVSRRAPWRARVAQELGGETGGLVGYKVRFHDRVRPETCIELMGRDGILLAELQQDRSLHEYDTLIIDECPRAGPQIEFLLGAHPAACYRGGRTSKSSSPRHHRSPAVCHPFRERRGPAALDLAISGRTYPVEVRIAPGGGERGRARRRDAGRHFPGGGRTGPGGAGAMSWSFSPASGRSRDRRDPAQASTALDRDPAPYARQSPAEQARIFQAHGTRRVVLATNVAETSLTVPGIDYVIDPGFARISRYSHRSKVQRLPVERVSQASANQRRGRCGRVAAGICIRLYTQDNFESRTAFTEPEIHRANLAAVILRMKLLGFGEIESFPFVDPPDGRLVADGYRTRKELAALDGQGQLTPLGQHLAGVPWTRASAAMSPASADLGRRRRCRRSWPP